MAGKSGPFWAWLSFMDELLLLVVWMLVLGLSIDCCPLLVQNKIWYLVLHQFLLICSCLFLSPGGLPGILSVVLRSKVRESEQRRRRNGAYGGDHDEWELWLAQSFLYPSLLELYWALFEAGPPGILHHCSIRVIVRCFIHKLFISETGILHLLRIRLITSLIQYRTEDAQHLSALHWVNIASLPTHKLQSDFYWIQYRASHTNVHSNASLSSHCLIYYLWHFCACHLLTDSQSARKAINTDMLPGCPFHFKVSVWFCDLDLVPSCITLFCFQIENVLVYRTSGSVYIVLIFIDIILVCTDIHWYHSDVCYIAYLQLPSPKLGCQRQSWQ